MARPPETRVQVEDFPGEVNNADPADIPRGSARVQINLVSRIMGELNVRRGYRPAAFDSQTLISSLAGD